MTKNWFLKMACTAGMLALPAAASAQVLCVHDGGNDTERNTLVDQLENGFGYTTTLSTDPVADNCDVFVSLPGSGGSTPTNAGAFVDAGGGFVQISDHGPDLLANTFQSVGGNSDHTLVIGANAHPIVAGLDGTYTVKGFWRYGFSQDYLGWVTGGGTNLGSIDGNDGTISYLERGDGRYVYLGWNVYGPEADNVSIDILRRSLIWTGLTPRCTNGSVTDCNPDGTTLIPGSAFVDPNPPQGFTQCAGFTNTADDDVAWNWENNCIPFKDGTLYMRLFDDATGDIIAGARLFDPPEDLRCFAETQRDYFTDSFEGEGFLSSPAPGCSQSGTTLAFHEADASFCSCSRPGGGSGTCNDIFTASAANDKILYVGGNSSNHNYEATWGAPGGKNTCTLNNELVRLRVAIYTGEVIADRDSDGVLDDDDNCPDNANADQLDTDNDGLGDVCDDDDDADGVADGDDN